MGRDSGGEVLAADTAEAVEVKSTVLGASAGVVVAAMFQVVLVSATKAADVVAQEATPSPEPPIVASAGAGSAEGGRLGEAEGGRLGEAEGELKK